MYRLFIVEDDPGIANAVAAQAQAWNLQTHIVQDFSNVMHEFAEFSPHIVLLDIMLPFFDGYHWCSEIRRVSKVPIIFISSAADNMNIVMAVNMGGVFLCCRAMIRQAMAVGRPASIVNIASASAYIGSLSGDDGDFGGSGAASAAASVNQEAFTQSIVQGANIQFNSVEMTVGSGDALDSL